MKRYILFLPALVVVILASNAIWAQNKAAAGFDQLKSLAGEWRGKDQDGNQLEVIYQVVSGSSAIIETLQNSKEPSMITPYLSRVLTPFDYSNREVYDYNRVTGAPS